MLPATRTPKPSPFINLPTVAHSGGGVITIVTLVSPYRADRDAARKRHEEQGIKFIEVLMDVPLEACTSTPPARHPTPSYLYT